MNPRSAAQMRIIRAALDQFARHGVGGTSLQMIADAIGVSKAAVYHQFNTKDEIVLAVAEVELVRIETAVSAAEQASSRREALELLLAQIVDMAVARRRVVATLQNDPVIVRLLAEHPPFSRLMERLYRVVVGDEATAEARVPAAMMSAAFGGAVMHPLVVDLDDETLRHELMRLARRMFALDQHA